MRTAEANQWHTSVSGVVGTLPALPPLTTVSGVSMLEPPGDPGGIIWWRPGEEGGAGGVRTPRCLTGGCPQVRRSRLTADALPSPAGTDNTHHTGTAHAHHEMEKGPCISGQCSEAAKHPDSVHPYHVQASAHT
eukprot:977448-Prorocentrum_minimum.AAC.2